MNVLLIGGARSGKSSLAEKLAIASNKRVCYLATAQPFDCEMSKRIEHHQGLRPKSWQLIEEPLELVTALEQAQPQAELVLIDCLTLWLNNLLFRGDSDNRVACQVDELCVAIKQSTSDTIWVSNEVGQGVIADNPLARRFVDHSGWMNQKLAATCEHVAFVTAGLPLWLKGTAPWGL